MVACRRPQVRFTVANPTFPSRRHRFWRLLRRSLKSFRVVQCFVLKFRAHAEGGGHAFPAILPLLRRLAKAWTLALASIRGSVVNTPVSSKRVERPCPPSNPGVIRGSVPTQTWGTRYDITPFMFYSYRFQRVGIVAGGGGALVLPGWARPDLDIVMQQLIPKGRLFH